MTLPCCTDCAEREPECRGEACPYRPDPPAPSRLAEKRLNVAAARYALAPTEQAWQEFLAATDEYRVVSSP